MLKAPLVMLQQFRIVTPQFMRAQQEFCKVDQAAAITDFLVACVQRNELAAIGIALVVQMLRPQALILLTVDEILDLPRDPAAVIQLQVFKESLDDAQLIIRVDDLEVLWQLCLIPVTSQQPMREAVKRADPQVVHRHIQKRLDTPAHLRRGLVGKGDRQQALWRYAFDVDQPCGSVHQHPGLAAASAGDDQQGLGWRGNGLPLRVIQGFENWCDVHD